MGFSYFQPAGRLSRQEEPSRRSDIIRDQVEPRRRHESYRHAPFAFSTRLSGVFFPVTSRSHRQERSADAHRRRRAELVDSTLIFTQ